MYQSIQDFPYYQIPCKNFDSHILLGKMHNLRDISVTRLNPCMQMKSFDY